VLAGYSGVPRGCVEYSRGTPGVPQRGSRGIPVGCHGVRWVLTGSREVRQGYFTSHRVLTVRVRVRVCVFVCVCMGACRCTWLCVCARASRGLSFRVCARLCVRARLRASVCVLQLPWWCVCGYRECVVVCVRARICLCARDFVWFCRSIGKHLRACVACACAARLRVCASAAGRALCTHGGAPRY
jgi:hypothetical protein